MVKCLITGGAGFIGSNIADVLVAEKYKVRILDDFSTGAIRNIEHLDGKVELINGSITNRELVKKAVKGVEYIFHEAAQTSVVDSIKNPVKTWDVNIKGTKLLLNAAVKNKVKKVILASSANVYGNDPSLPKKEDMKIKPTSAYGESKLIDEIMARKYYERDKLKTVCLRYFNVYGPRQNSNSDYSGVISKFIKRMLANESPVIYGDGQQTRDFIYVKDVVRANILAMESDKAVGKVINIATGKPTSINELVEILKRIIMRDLSPRYEQKRIGDIKHSYADTKKAEKILGFEAEYSLENGLTKTVEWIKKQ